MRFIYRYKTSDNEPREGEIRAADRDDVYSRLKKRGIRPFSVEDAPGFFNRLFGHGKRWIAIAVLSVVAILAIVSAVTVSRQLHPRELARQQIVGDQFVLEDGLATQWSNVLSNPGDRWLAMYAMPGRKPRRGLAVSSPIEIYVAVRELEENIEKPVSLVSMKLPEYEQLRAIVEGMKRDLREHVARGGKIDDYLEQLEARQNQEVHDYERAVMEMRSVVEKQGCNNAVRDLWVQKNAELRARGLMALPGPEQF